MKFLLVAINAKYIHSNLAVYSLKSYAEKYGQKDIQIEIAEYTINQYADEILRDIYEKKPDAIGFSCYIWNVAMIKSIIADYKKICPETHIWLGGPEVSYNVKQVLAENTFVDYVMYGEGEETFKNITDIYGANDSDFEKVKGIAFRKNNEIVVNPPEPPVDLSSVPFVYQDMNEFENKIIYYETSRGCPFSCSYCLSSIDKKLRFRDLELVKTELKFFIDNNTRQVKFVDRTFNCKHDHAMEIWKFIKDHDNGVTNFHFEVAADLMTEDEISLIRTMRPGLIQLEIGVQSTNEKTLEAINRKTNLSKIAQVTSEIRQGKNIHQHLDLIAGLPYEDYLSFANSFTQVYAMKPDQLQLGFLKVLHGSMMEAGTEQFEIIYSDSAPYEVLSTKWLSFEELLKLKEVENVVEIYYNSFQFVYTINMLEKEFDNSFQMYEELGEYYKRHSLNGEKHSRVTRYNLLLNFIEETISKNKKNRFMVQTIEESCLKDRMVRYREALTLDYYLRENAKTRPDFALDISEYKREIRMFFQSGAIRSILPDYRDYDSRQIEKMTHVEIFGIDREEKTYILFDYKNRNPLNKQAGTVDITEWIKGKGREQW